MLDALRRRLHSRTEIGLSEYDDALKMIRNLRDHFCKEGDERASRKFLLRADNRIEWVCEHGVGHTLFSFDEYYVHGCDGCCGSDEFKTAKVFLLLTRGE